MNLFNSNRVTIIFGRAVTLETLKRNCRLAGHPDGYADVLWRSYWTKRDTDQDRTGALNELIRLSFTPDEVKKLQGCDYQEE